MAKHWLIPDDWTLDGGEWENHCITWPKSEQWFLLLRSLMFSLTRGREWDTDGSIRDAQAIGWQIFDRNLTPPGCDGGENGDGEDGTGIVGVVTTGGGLILLDRGEEMAQGIVTEVKIVGGKLRVYYGHCCFEDLEVTGLSSGGTLGTGGEDGSGEDLPTPTDGDPLSYYACGKAWGIVNAVYALITAMYDAIATADYPWQVLGNAEHAVGFNLDNTHLALLWMDTVNMIIGGIAADDIFSPNDRANVACALAQYFNDDETGVPDEAAYTAVKACFQARNLWYFWFIQTAIYCYGRGNLNTIAKIAALDGDSTCLCGNQIPTGETTPDALGWYLSVPLEPTEYVGDGGAIALGWQGEAVHDVYGVFFVLNTTNEGVVKRSGCENTSANLHLQFLDVAKTLTGNTSDHLETMNQILPFIQLNSASIVETLAQQRGYPIGWLLGGAVDSPIIASPEAPAGSGILGVRIDVANDVTVHDLIELRLIHNTNSPSHTP